jgi:hypothetical protein
MQIKVGAVSTDLSYNVFFEEPRFEFLTLEGQIKWFGYFRKDFSLTLNDIKVNREAMSNNFFHFSKAYGKAFLDVSYGLEQVHASISNPSQSEQLSRLYSALTASFQEAPISSQRFMIQEQFSTDQGAASYLKELNPGIPGDFAGHLEANMVGYTLRYPESNLTIDIVLAPSMFVPKGLYMHRTLTFTPSLGDYRQTIDIVQERLAEIQKVLGIEYEGEVLHVSLP